MNIEQLQYFLTASKYNSFSSAANYAFTSRQNLTRSIEMLESELGVKLFLRGRKGIALTEEGVIVEKKARKILAEIEDLENTFRSENGSQPDREINIAFGVNFCDDIPGVNLGDFAALPAAIHELTIPDCHAGVAAENLDLAFVICMKREFSGCVSTPIKRIPLYVMCSTESEIASKDSVEMKDLQGHGLFMEHDSEKTYGKFLEEYCRLEIPDSYIREIATPSTMRFFVQSYDGVSFTTPYCACNPADGLVLRPWGNDEHDFYCYVLTNPKSNKNKDVRRAIRKVHDIVDTLPDPRSV